MKNPFISLWLSSANRVMGSARGHAMAEAKRQTGRMQAEGARTLMDLWSGKAVTARAAAKPKPKARRTR